MTDLEMRAWNRSGGCCEGCGKDLDFYSRGRQGNKSWEVHHIQPRNENGGDNYHNLSILCTTGENCHLNRGHDGNYSQRGSFNRLQNEPLARAAVGASAGAFFGGPVGALVGGVLGAITTPDLEENE